MNDIIDGVLGEETREKGPVRAGIAELTATVKAQSIENTFEVRVGKNKEFALEFRRPESMADQEDFLKDCYQYVVTKRDEIENKKMPTHAKKILVEAGLLKKSGEYARPMGITEDLIFIHTMAYWSAKNDPITHEQAMVLLKNAPLCKQLVDAIDKNHKLALDTLTWDGVLQKKSPSRPTTLSVSGKKPASKFLAVPPIE